MSRVQRTFMRTMRRNRVRSLPFAVSMERSYRSYCYCFDIAVNSMSDEPASFALAKFDRGDRNPNNHSPEETVEAFLAAVRSGRIKPTHVVISYSQLEENGAGDSGYFQGGRLDYLGQMGLLTRVLNLMNDPGEHR